MSKINNNKFNPLWVTGISNSNGNFSIIYNYKTNKITTSFKVTQKDHSLIILTDLKEFFKCGNINIDNRKFNTYKYTVSNTSDLINIIIPHFDKYPLIGSKHLDFLDWKTIIELKSKNEHKNVDNLQNIINIKTSMNRNRLLNTNLLNSTDKLKIINWSNLSLGKKGYHTKINIKNKFLFNLKLLLFILSLIIVSFMYIYLYEILILCLEKFYFILFFFFLTIFYLDNFKLSFNKIIKYFQIIIFISFICYIIYSVFYIFENSNFLFNETIFHLNEEDKQNITLQGKVVLSKEAGAEVAKGISSLGSNIGLGACVGALAGGVRKSIALSGMPPLQKAGLVIAGGVIGAIIHTGSSIIGAKTHKSIHNTNNVQSNSIDPNLISKDINKFMDFGNNNTPLEILLQCIITLNSISMWLVISLSTQIFFKLFVKDKPSLKFIDFIFPDSKDNIKLYIYKLIKFNKNMSKIYIIITVILLFISLAGSTYFATELFEDINSYVDIYIEYYKK